MNQQKKNLDKIKRGQSKGLPLSSIEILEAKKIVFILEAAIESGYTTYTLRKLFNGVGNNDLVKSEITPYPGKMYELTGKSNKNVFQIRIGSQAGKNRVRFRWDNNGIELLGVGEFHQQHEKNVK